MLNVLSSEFFESVGFNVGIELLASLVWAPLSFLFVYLWMKTKEHFYKHRLYKNIRLKLHDSKQKLMINCFYANSNKVDKNESAALGYPFEYMAAATVQSYLSFIAKKNFQMDMCPSPLRYDEVLKETDENLLLLGGPFHNNYTRFFFGLEKDNTNLPFYFDSYEGEEATLFFNNGLELKKFKPKKDITGKFYTDDYGIILNMKNVYNNDKRIIALIGCRTIGVLGAAVALTKLNKQLFERTNTYDEYAVVVCCHGNRYNIMKDPEICECIELHSIEKTQLILEKR